MSKPLPLDLEEIKEKILNNLVGIENKEKILKHLAGLGEFQYEGYKSIVKSALIEFEREIIQRIKSAVEWYLRYRNLIGTFLNEQPQYFEELATVLNERFSKNWWKYWNTETTEEWMMINVYNKWLFEKAFERALKK